MFVYLGIYIEIEIIREGGREAHRESEGERHNYKLGTYDVINHLLEYIN